MKGENKIRLLFATVLLVACLAMPAAARKFDWQQVAYLGRDPFTDPSAGEWYISNPALYNYTQLGFRWSSPRISGLAVDNSRHLLYVATAVGYGYGKLQVWDTSSEPYTKLKEWNTWYKLTGPAGKPCGGSITQIVIGGDGNAYAVVNSTFSYDNDSNYGHCILKIYYDESTSSWKRDVIWQPESHPGCPTRGAASRYNSIRGICVDRNGNIEWVMDPSGSNTFWNYHHRQILDVQTGEIFCDGCGLNTGGGFYMGMCQVGQCIGEKAGEFGFNYPVIGTNVHFAAGQTLKAYRDVFDGYSIVSHLATAGVGYAKVTTTSAYDPVNATLWFGFHGDQGCWDPNCGYGTTAIANVRNSDWANNKDWSKGEFITAHVAPATPDLYNPADEAWNLDRLYYLASVRKKLWVSALAADTSSGDALYSVVGETTEYNTAPDSPVVRRTAYKGSDVDPVTNPYFGHVLRMNQDCTKITDEGRPNPTGQVVAIAEVTPGNFIVETLDTQGNRYLYKSVPVARNTMSLNQIKKAESGTAIRTDGPKTVTWPATGTSATYFYIEEADKSCGIKVIPRNPAAIPVKNDRVDITEGTVQTIRGELVIDDAVFTIVGTGEEITPIAASGAAMGGSRLGDQPPIPTGSRGGASNVGLLMRIAGKVGVVVVDDRTGNQWFTIDDGSGVTSTYVDLAGVTQIVPGVKVQFAPTNYSVGDILGVTGVLSVDHAPGIFQRVLLPRDANDINTVAE